MTREGNVVVIPAYNERDNIAFAINALNVQLIAPEAIVVVDNNSTDDTSDIVQWQQRRQPNLHLIQESQKGVNYASNTGFRYAIDELQAGIVSKVDADTQVYGDWNDTVTKYFASRPGKQLLTGSSYPSRDDFYRFRDEILWPAARLGYRIVNLATTRSRFPLRVAHGHNMAIRGKTFDAVGGFPAVSWEECSGNVELSKRIYELYGLEALGYSADMKVRTSMRRVRSVGYLGLVLARGNLAGSPSYGRLVTSGKDIDIR